MMFLILLMPVQTLLEYTLLHAQPSNKKFSEVSSSSRSTRLQSLQVKLPKMLLLNSAVMLETSTATYFHTRYMSVTNNMMTLEITTGLNCQCLQWAKLCRCLYARLSLYKKITTCFSVMAFWGSLWNLGRRLVRSGSSWLPMLLMNMNLRRNTR